MCIDYNSLEEVQVRLRYYEDLLGYLDDHVPCLDDLITMFDESGDEDVR